MEQPVNLTILSCLEFNMVLMLIIGYVFGSIPVAYLYCKARGVNIFECGSGNPGSTNVGRVLGKKHGKIVFALDILKTIIPIFLAHVVIMALNRIETCDVFYSIIDKNENYPLKVLMYGGTFRDPVVIFTTGLGAILGHNFPFTTKFKGGKGITCTVAVIAYFNILYAIILYCIHKIIGKVTGYVSLASILTLIIMFISATVFTIFKIYPFVPFNNVYPRIILPEIFIMMVLGIARHKENIARLEAGKENKT